MSAETCSAYWYDGLMSGKCQRPVKEGGLCAQHLAGKRRSQAADAKRKERHAADDAVKERVYAKIATLQSLGLTRVSADWSPVSRGYTGRVIVDPDELLTLLAKVTDV